MGHVSSRLLVEYEDPCEVVFKERQTTCCDKTVTATPHTSTIHSSKPRQGQIVQNGTGLNCSLWVDHFDDAVNVVDPIDGSPTAWDRRFPQGPQAIGHTHRLANRNLFLSIRRDHTRVEVRLISRVLSCLRWIGRLLIERRCGPGMRSSLCLFCPPERSSLNTGNVTLLAGYNRYSTSPFSYFNPRRQSDGRNSLHRLYAFSAVFVSSGL